MSKKKNTPDRYFATVYFATGDKSGSRSAAWTSRSFTDARRAVLDAFAFAITQRGGTRIPDGVTIVTITTYRRSMTDGSESKVSKFVCDSSVIGLDGFAEIESEEEIEKRRIERLKADNERARASWRATP